MSCGRRTPEERSGFQRGFEFQVSPDGSDGFYSFCAWCVAREHHIEIGQVALLETFVDIADLFC